MKRVALLLICVVAAYAQEKVAKEDVAIAPKEKKVIVVLGIDKVEKFDFAPSTKVDVGNENIVSYQLIPQKKEIVLKGVKPGDSSIRIRDTVGDTRLVLIVKVTATAQSKIVKELKEFIGDVEGLEIGIKSDKVYVGGKIIVPGDIGKVAIILRDDKFKDVLRLVELSPHTKTIIARKMQSEIQGLGMKNVTVRIVNGSFWLEGVVDSDGKKQFAEKVALAYMPDNIQNLAQQTDSVQTIAKNPIQNFVTVNEKSKPQPIPKLLKITAQFVELTKQYSKVFGFKWNPFIAGDGGSINIGKTGSTVSTKSSDGLAATISNLFPKLASARSAGHARVIQSGVIVTKEDVKAVIEKSSSQPYAVGSGEFSKAKDAKSGFTMEVTPKVLKDEKVNMIIGVSISSNVGDPPATLENKISTQLIVKSKSSAVIGGIVVMKSATDYDKHPPGGVDSADNASALFSFIRSKSYLSDKSQFVVFVTPEIIESASEGTDEIKRKFRKRRR